MLNKEKTPTMRTEDIPILNLKISMMRKGNFYVKIPMNWGKIPKEENWTDVGEIQMLKGKMRGLLIG